MKLAWSRSANLALAGVLLGIVLAAVIAWYGHRGAGLGDAGLGEGVVELRPFVASRPPVPIVFTSRTEAVSLLASAPEGEVYTFPGQRLWQAREGRLRLLTPQGSVHELTWGQLLPDGGSLIDVMSPTIAADGTSIVFAGRKGGGDPGHFRLYEIGTDGTGLRQLTGGADDTGCLVVPPLRYAADGGPLSDEQRRRVDYDDIDPAYHPDGRIVFVSSRVPDLGRGHSRRATHLWIMNADGSERYPLTANRNNDRWAWVLSSGFVAFSLWSHNQEAITADLRDIRPYEEGGPFLRPPPDAWLGAIIEPTSSRFGGMVKTHFPVWRPRALVNGRIAFMTDVNFPKARDDVGKIWSVVQTESGLLHNAPSALHPDHPLPRQKDYRFFQGPNRDSNGRTLSAATPSPCPPDGVLLAAAALDPGETSPLPGRYGIYWTSQDWPLATAAAAPARAVNMRLLFDDPRFVDAEPVAVYVRDLPFGPFQPKATGEVPGRGTLTLFGDKTYHGPVGSLFNAGVDALQDEGNPGQLTDAGQGPIFDRPPPGAIAQLRVYASQRDRFDDLVKPRIHGKWEEILRLALERDQDTPTGSASLLLPVGFPMVLAGFDRHGQVAHWTTAAQDSLGQQATFFAIAGDHYAGVRPGHRDFCVGCHVGHSGPGRIRHAERHK